MAGRPKKDPFEDLPEDFKDAVTSASVNELKDKLSDVAKNEEANLAAKKADPDLAESKEAVKVASEGYREITKQNKLKRKFIIQQMALSGDDLAQKIVQMDLDAK